MLISSQAVLLVVQSTSQVVSNSATSWTAACQASLSLTVSPTFLKLMSIDSMTPSNHLVLCHPLLLPSSIFPSIRVFSNESALRIRWPKYWSFSFSVSPSNEYSGLISFRMDWLDFLAIQGMLKSLPQHHNLKASFLQCSAYYRHWSLFHLFPWFMFDFTNNFSHSDKCPSKVCFTLL